MTEWYSPSVTLHQWDQESSSSRSETCAAHAPELFHRIGGQVGLSTGTSFPRADALGAPLRASRGSRQTRHQLTRWVLRTARLRAPATQAGKGAARERRGTSYAALTVGSGGS